MDMPIKIIMTLVVSLIVAVSILFFAQDTLNNARDRMRSFEEKEDPEQVIDLEEISNQQVLTLAEECYFQNNAGTPTRMLCFAVHGKVTADQATVNASWSVPNSTLYGNFSSGINGLFIYYNPFKNGIEVVE